MQRIAKIMTVVACALFVVCALLVCVEYACFDRSFYDSEYRKLDTAHNIGMSHSSLITVTEHLLDYVQNEEPELKISVQINGKERNVFDERDTAHMVDVKALYLTVRTVRTVLIPVIVLLLCGACFMVHRERVRLLASGCIIGVVIAGVAIGAFVIWAAVDFNSFWTAFHKVFFSNDLWMLDPAQSILINMVPSQFFYDLVMRIVTLSLITIGVPLVLSIIYMAISRVRRKSLMTLPEE